MIATVWLMLCGLMYSLQLQTGSFPKPLSAPEEQHYMLQARWQFIMGVRDPQDDEAWNNYFATLKTNGEEPLLETYQSAYTRVYG